MAQPEPMYGVYSEKTGKLLWMLDDVEQAVIEQEAGREVYLMQPIAFRSTPIEENELITSPFFTTNDVNEFERGWHIADQQGNAGNRIRAGLLRMFTERQLNTLMEREEDQAFLAGEMNG